MAFATSNGSKIAYETLGTGPTVVMQHGLFGNRHSWQDCGFVAALQADYQLMLIDSLGHGESDCPHESARYALESRADDIAAVLGDLGVERAHYVGYSMGGCPAHSCSAISGYELLLHEFGSAKATFERD